MKEDVFMSLPVSGKTYTFECLGAEGMFLNLYYSNGVSDGQNVILWEGDGSLEQQWKYNGSKLLTVRNTNFALDKYTFSGSANNNNADVWTANDPTNQNIVFVATSSGNDVVKIKLASSNMYLTAYGFENGTSGGKTPTSTGNVYWTSSDKATMQQWIFREVGGSVDPEPGEMITVTNMPSGIYSNDTEYFHPQSGMVNGTWVQNNGSYIQNKIKNYYKTIYGVEPDSADQYLYNLFGAKLTGRNDYHIGVDIWHGSGSKITSAHSGTVIKAGNTDSNEVAIYDGERTYYYLHMKDRYVEQGDTVIAGKTVLGTEGQAGWATGSHLHLEVFDGQDFAGPKDTPLVNESIPSICPYDYI